MEIYLPAGCRVPGRVAGGDDRLQDAASALGQGINSDGEKDSAASDAQRRIVAHQDRSLVSPHCKFELSADDHTFGADIAGDDYPFLSGMVSDAVHRSAALYGVDLLYFQFLPGFSARTFSQDLAASTAVSAVPDGVGRGVDHHQHQSGDRSAHRQGKRIRTYA